MSATVPRRPDEESAHPVGCPGVVSLLVTGTGSRPGGRPQQGLPRASDGRPDLSGIWQVMNHAAWNIQDQNAEPGPAGAPWLGIPASRGSRRGQRDPVSAVGARQEAGELREPADRRPGDQLLPARRAAHHVHAVSRSRSSRRRPTSAILYEYVHADPPHLHGRTPHPEGRSSGGWATRAAAGRATRSSST